MYHDYIHHIMVKDLNWFPSWDHVSALHRVLMKWELVSQLPSMSNISSQPWRKVHPSDTIPSDLRLSYPDAPGETAKKLGFPKEQLRVSAILGHDYRVMRADRFKTRTLAPPFDCGSPLFLRNASDQDNPSWGLHDSYYGSESSTHPLTELKVDGKVYTGFSGVWRSGVFLSPLYGRKPRWYSNGKMPARDFIIDLEEAFSTKLLEFGLIT